MQSADILKQNIEKLEKLFPSCVSEGKVNFEAFKQLFSDKIIDGDEAYNFTWVGKKAAVVEAHTPIRKTLRPCVEESVNWDKTENLYIEGDNLEVLKLLQESYLGKVKMIYIDPPYNTGNDFIYRDDFSIGEEEYAEMIGNISEGERLYKNTDSNGRFHSDWCSMIYSRLLLARNLLADDGVIFISIDDNEQSNLKQICDEVFGENNFAAEIPWQSRLSMQNDTDFSINHEYLLVYAKKRRIENRRLKESNANTWYKKDSFVFRPLPLDKSKFDNPDNDPRGLWKADPFDAPNIRPNLTYTIKNPNTGEEFLPPQGRCWRVMQEKFIELFNDNRIIFGKNGTSRPQMKSFYEEKKDFGSIDNSWFAGDKIGTATAATKELQKIFNCIPFDTPKPTTLMKKLLILGFVDNDDIVMDFFSGSATTAHAVMQLNAEDRGHRKFIMVQLPELTDEKSEAFKTGYKNICEIGKERIRRAGNKIKADNPLTTTELDVGFRVFKLDSTNMNDVYYSPDEYSQDMLAGLESNIKDDRTALDLLFGCILDWGLPLSLPYTSEEIDGCTIHDYNEGDLIACFDKNIPKSVIEVIAKKKPLRAVFRDSSFEADDDRINVEEIFKLYAPDTRVKVI